MAGSWLHVCKPRPAEGIPDTTVGLAVICAVHAGKDSGLVEADSSPAAHLWRCCNTNAPAGNILCWNSNEACFRALDLQQLSTSFICALDFMAL